MLENLFNPKGVAVIGASGNPQKIGYALASNLVTDKKDRRIFLVNPSEKEILGEKVFADVKDIKENVDLAVIAVKPEIVPNVLRACGEKKIPYCIIITAGYKEIGEEGKKREDELKQIAKNFNIKIIGPNCLGIFDCQNNLNATFGDKLPGVGNISVISQSGAVGTSMLDFAKKENIGFAKFISVGNEAGLTENDFLEYLLTDENTKAIALYLEAVSDGTRFLELAKKITAVKPLVVLKAGKTARGAQAVASHTGSLASENKIFEAVCAQAKVINVETISQMFDLLKMFNAGIYQPLENIGIVTNGGGPSIILADLLELSQSLNLATLTDKTKTALREVLPITAAVGNPVDVIGDALSDRYESALKILSKVKDIDALAVILTPQKMTQIKETAKIISKINKKKVLLPLFIGGIQIEPALKIFRQKNIAYFSDPIDLVKALDYMSFKNKIVIQNKKEEAVVDQLDFSQTEKLLKSVGLSTSGILLSDKKEIISAMGKLPGPYVLKAITDKVLHKSDVGALKLNLQNAEEVEKAWEEISKNVFSKTSDIKIEGMLLQSMTAGREVIIGMKRDTTFGPTIVFGLGGIFVEALKDVSMRVAPLTPGDIDNLIGDIKGINILKGTRGQKAINFEALKQTILAISNLVTAHPEIKEMDFNPVFCDENGVSLVDVRIV
ncbi:MAG TPA: acetate--CoA ligase family protein [Candidatus Magasanikbacteria bacterium]|nr:acetate--CoA ligase family protein [Candidatus Magasanikbacteria bacterium]